MFHYRLKPLNNRSRMLIAIFVAVALHVGLMSFEFNLKPVLVPSISLPRSVSVFLNQRNIVATPEEQTEKSQKTVPLFEEQHAVVKELAKPLSQKKITPREIKDNPLQQPTVLEKTAVEKIFPATLSPEGLEKYLMPEQGETVKVQEPVPQGETQAAQENYGVTVPGTLQVAYPRYQLNAPPTYPGLARKRGQEGTVILQVLVSKEGRVDDLTIETSSGFRLLDRAAVVAVQQWLFAPGQRDGKRAEMWVKVPVTFKLK